MALTIKLGLLLIPFISIPGQDIRELKLALFLGVCLILALLGFWGGEMKFKNLPALLLLPYVWLSTMMAPGSGLKLSRIDLGIFWAWKPFVYFIAALIAIIAIANARLDKKGIKSILSWMFWCGFAMAVYVGFQAAGFDQFFKSNGQVNEQWNLAGTIGHPTFVGAFIAMTIPVAIFLKKYWQAVLMICIVCIIQSAVAIGAMCLSLLFIYANRSRKGLILSIAILLCLVGLVFLIHDIHPQSVSNMNRFYNWKLILQDVSSPIRPGLEAVFPITGRGLGSFYYTFHEIHQNNYFQAHNEYLQMLYDCGFAGLGLMLLAMWYMIKTNFRKSWYKTCLLGSFICIAINAGGTFVWQLGATIYYSLIVAGLLHNPQEA